MDLERLRLKNLIRELDGARGSATSMVSLVLSVKDSVIAANRLLIDELGAASNIKSRVNRQSVQWAIVAAQQKLKLFSKMPPNGLVIYCGEVGEGKPVSVAFEPHKPLNTFKYLCDNHFFTEPLADLLKDEKTFGFIIADGNGAALYKVAGNRRERVGGFTVSLPNKTRRGGQSSARFSRLRDEAVQLYMRKIGEAMAGVYLTEDILNVEGLFICGSGEVKDHLIKDGQFSAKLHGGIRKVLDIQYGGSQGLNEALNALTGEIAGLGLLDEKVLLSDFFQHLAKDTGLVCYGRDVTISALGAGLVATLIIWEDITEFDVESLGEQCSDTSTILKLVSDRTTEGAQFVHGFGGVGAILRYAGAATALEGDEVDGIEWESGVDSDD